MYSDTLKSNGQKKGGGDGEFPVGPVVKTSSSNAGGASLIPGWGAKIPHASGPKTQNTRPEAIL